MSRFEKFIEVFLIAAILFMLAVAAYAFYSAYVSSRGPKFELNKNNWACSKSEEQTHLQPTLVGKVTIMMPITRTVCLEYRHVE